MTETRIVGSLPHLDIAVVHREERGAEMVSIHFKATPNFDVAARALAQFMAPLAMAMVNEAWLKMVQATWAPWLALTATVPRKR